MKPLNIELLCYRTEWFCDQDCINKLGKFENGALVLIVFYIYVLSPQLGDHD